jgi:hypothetical protein
MVGVACRNQDLLTIAERTLGSARLARFYSWWGFQRRPKE